MSQGRGIYVSGLTWWTTDEALKLIAEQAGTLEDLVDEELTFLEHKVNGKSRGVAYMKFRTFEAAEKTSKFLQEIEIYSVQPEVAFAPEDQVGNPFRLITTNVKEARYDSVIPQKRVTNYTTQSNATTFSKSSVPKHPARGKFSNMVAVFNNS